MVGVPKSGHVWREEEAPRELLLAPQVHPRRAGRRKPPAYLATAAQIRQRRSLGQDPTTPQVPHEGPPSEGR